MKTAVQTMSNGNGRPRLSRRRIGQAAAIILGAALAASLPSLGLHAPDWSVMAAQSPVVQAHAAAAGAALVVGAGLMVGVKGRSLHRRLGWVCIVLVAVTALTSLFIKTSGSFSLIHGLSAWTLLALPVAVLAARRHQVTRHRRMMTALFYGGLVIAGLFTFVPGRVMHTIFFG